MVAIEAGVYSIQQRDYSGRHNGYLADNPSTLNWHDDENCVGENEDYQGPGDLFQLFKESLPNTPLLESFEEKLLGQAIMNNELPEVNITNCIDNVLDRIRSGKFSTHPESLAQVEMELPEIVREEFSTCNDLESKIELLEKLRLKLDYWNNFETLDDLKEYFVSANYGLIVHLVKNFRVKGTTFIDLIQVGYLGLQKAVNGFEYEKGKRFSTYAGHKIIKEIRRFIELNYRTIYVPVWMSERLNKFQKEVARLAQQLNREPRPEDILMYTSIKEFKKEANVVECFRLLNNHELVSLSEPVGDGDSVLEDFIASEDEGDEFNLPLNVVREVGIDQILSTLPMNQDLVLRLKYALFDEVWLDRMIEHRKSNKVIQAGIYKANIEIMLDEIFTFKNKRKGEKEITNALIGKIFGVSGNTVSIWEREAKNELRLTLMRLIAQAEGEDEGSASEFVL